MARQKISGTTEEELHASTVAALRAEILRVGKPLEELSKEELVAALPEGLGVDTKDEDTARYVSEIGLELGIPMDDPTLDVSEPFEAETHRDSAPVMQMERTLMNLYLLRVGCYGPVRRKPTYQENSFVVSAFCKPRPAENTKWSCSLKS